MTHNKVISPFLASQCSNIIYKPCSLLRHCHHFCQVIEQFTLFTAKISDNKQQQKSQVISTFNELKYNKHYLSTLITEFETKRHKFLQLDKSPTINTLNIKTSGKKLTFQTREKNMLHFQMHRAVQL